MVNEVLEDEKESKAKGKPKQKPKSKDTSQKNFEQITKLFLSSKAASDKTVDTLKQIQKQITNIDRMTAMKFCAYNTRVKQFIKDIHSQAVKNPYHTKWLYLSIKLAGIINYERRNLYTDGL